MRHALVSGAGGFIGSVLCTALRAQGVRVTALSRSGGEGPWDTCIALDLTHTAPVLADDVDTVFHLAGHAHADSIPGEAASLHAAVSVDGTRRLLSACGPTVARFVYVSSVKAVGESTPAHCIDETVDPRPSTAYGRARLEAERLVLAQASRLHAVVVRLPLVYGPGVKGNLARMMRAVAARRLPLLPDFGNRRSLVHVDDVCAALLAAARVCAARGRVYFLTDGEVYSTREIQQLMYTAAGCTPPGSVPSWVLRGAAAVGDMLHGLGVRRVPIDGAALEKLSGDACFDCARARRDLGYAPAHTLADSLPAMFRGLVSPPAGGTR